MAIVDELADPAHLFAERRTPGWEGSVSDMLRDSRWSNLRWHVLRRGGCAAGYHRGPHLRFLMWWGRWRRLQTALEYATRCSDMELVGPRFLPVANAGDFVGTVVEVPVMELWPAAMYAKETVAIKDLVKELGTLPAADKCAPGRATEGGCAAGYHRGPHLRFLMWWGRWRRLQTALEYATRCSDMELVGPRFLPVANAGDFVGTVAEVPVMDLWPAAMYAKETVAIKDLVKELGTLPAADKCALGRATEGGCAAGYHRGPHLRFLMWWGRWRRLQTALEYATRCSDMELVGPRFLPVANAGDFVGTVAEVPVMDLWPAAMYAKETSPSRTWSRSWEPCRHPTNVHQSGPRK